MPAPADIQTKNVGAKGKAEKSDSITFTYADTAVPGAILAGWNGSATAVTVHIENNGKKDLLGVRNAATGQVLYELGLVELNGEYVKSSVDFTSSQMTASGKTVTIALGTPSAKVKDKAKNGTMVWWTTKGSAKESGPLDPEF